MCQPRDLLAALRRLFGGTVAVSAIALLVAGCSPPAAQPSVSPGTSPSPGTPAGASYEAHQGGGHGAHGGHNAGAMTRTLAVNAEPSPPVPAKTTNLALTIPGDDGKPVANFELLHEKLAHLIMIREGLDEFAHIHPDVAADGRLTTSHTFPKAGRYHLFVDYQPRGGTASMASGELMVAGEAPLAAPLIENIDQPLSDGDVQGNAKVTPSDGAAKIAFRLTDKQGKPLADLQPYLGAMGHLVVVSAKGMEYVHAHPLSEAKTAPDGIVEFQAHLPTSGLYKAWGQFRHNDRIVTLPVVFAYQSKP